MRKRFLGLLAVLGLAGPAWAAGALETDARAYSIRLENPKVRVLDVHLKPGQRVASHDLRERLLIIQEDAVLKVRDAHSVEKVVNARKGNISWEKAETVEIENSGDRDYRAIIIEFK